MTVETKVRALERQLPAGCPDCPKPAFVIREKLPDGTLGPPDHEPPPCAACGRVPEIIDVIEKPDFYGKEAPCPPSATA